jgi:protein SCO1/2
VSWASEPVRRAPRLPVVAFSLLLAVLVSAGGVWLLIARRAEALPIYGVLPSFSLVDRSGHTLTRDDLRGAPWIADFIFTRCAGVCPGLTARMARLQDLLPDEVRLVSFTVDPEHDDTAALARYAQEFHARPRWAFLTGPRETLYRVAIDGFKLEAMEVSGAERRTAGDGPFLHSSKLVLVDRRGRVRRYYDSEEKGVLERVAAEARQLTRER